MAEPKTISYEAHREAMEDLKWAHEQEAVRQSYIIKKLWILCMTIFITLVVVCVAIVHYESQWEVVEKTTEQTVTQDVQADGDSDAVVAGIGDATNGG